MAAKVTRDAQRCGTTLREEPHQSGARAGRYTDPGPAQQLQEAEDATTWTLGVNRGLSIQEELSYL